MKRVLYSAFIGAGLLLTSCESAKVAQQNRVEYLNMKGQWQLTSVDYDKNYKVQPFDENADIQCFVGSVWNLVPNNYTGSYQLNGGAGCPSVNQRIEWHMNGANEFMFKKIADGTKAKQNLSGYKLYLLNRTDNTFSLSQTVPSDNGTMNITYNFTKISK